MKNVRVAKISLATLSVFGLLLTTATAIKWPWERETPAPAPAIASSQNAQPEQLAGPPPPDDTARFFAGMPISKNSPLAPFTNDPAWQEHAANFETAFSKTEHASARKTARLGRSIFS
jgi:hypothetical protein